MTQSVIGLDVHIATQTLASQGVDVRCVEYVSRRGIEHADATRVIRQRRVGNNSIELTVSHFKTRIEK